MEFSNNCFLCLKVKSSSFRCGLNESLQRLIKSLKLTSIFSFVDSKSDIIVCDCCEKEISKFNHLLSKLEEIKMRINYQLQLIQNILNVDKKESELSQILSGENAEIRKRILSKCNKQVSRFQPKVKLSRIKWPIKKEIKQETLTKDNSQFEAFHELKLEIKEEPENPSVPEVEQVIQVKSEAEEIINSKYKCDKCKLHFETYPKFHGHNNRVHLKRYSCNVCGRFFGTLQNLQLHKANVKCDKPTPTRLDFTCPTCGKGFDAQAKLTWHKRKVHSQKKFDCDLCSRSYKLKQGLNRHMFKNHGAKFYCDVQDCNKIFGKYSLLHQHKRNEHPEMEAEKNYPPLSERNTSFQIISIKGKKMFECKFCKHLLKTRGSAYTHFNAVHQPKKFKCGHCGVLFATKKQRQLHMKRLYREIKLD